MRGKPLQFGFVLLCGVKLAFAASHPSQMLENFSENGVTFTYDRSYFEAAKLFQLPRKVEVKDEMPINVGPPRFRIQLLHAPRSAWSPGRPRYFQPSYSMIYITPLTDMGVPDFQRAYPGLAENYRGLQRLLASHPTNLNRYYHKIYERTLEYKLPDEPFNNAGAALLARSRFLHLKWGTAIRFLTYYQQDKTGYGATNAQLIYNFQGVTSGNDYYVSARFAVRHSALPDSIDDPRAKSDSTEQETRAEYERTNSWNDETFFPKLTDLDQMMDSLRIK